MKKTNDANNVKIFCGKIRRIICDWPIWTRISHCRKFIQDRKADDWRFDDQEENNRIRLPDDDGVQIPLITVVELYTPSQIGGLLTGITRLGWERGQTRSDDLLQWTSKVRQGSIAGSINLGLVGATDNKHYLTQERTANLPMGVHAAFPTLMTLTPSITAMVMSFFLDDESAEKLNNFLHCSYTTRVETDPSFRWRKIISYILFGGGIRFSRTIHRPMNQQRNAVAMCISAQEFLCTKWVKENFPGAFSSGIRGNSLPSAVLFVTEKTEFTDEKNRHHSAFDGIGFNHFFDAWKSEKWPSMRLFFSQFWNDANMRLSFACPRKNAFSNDAMYHSPESNWTIAQRTHEKISEVMTQWSLSCLLDGYHEQLSKLRDQSAIDNSHRTVRDLKQLRHLVRTEFYDIVTSAHEADDFVASNSDYYLNTLNLENIESAKRGHKIYLFNALRLRQREQSQRLLRETELLQSLLSVSSDLSQTITNINIQRLIVILTITSIAIGVMTLWLTIYPKH